MRYFSEKITTDELLFKLLNVSDSFDNDDVLWYIDENGEPTTEEEAINYLFYVLPSLLNEADDFKKVTADIFKIDFSTENVINKHFTGLTTLNNELATLICCAGGDWQIPVVFIIYWDGNGFRGYTPTKGNLFNVKTKTAYGNNEDPDDIGDYDWDEIYRDIENRISFKAK